jgi:hypothetical protein
VEFPYAWARKLPGKVSCRAVGLRVATNRGSDGDFNGEAQRRFGIALA